VGTKTGPEKGYSVSALARMMGVDRRTLASRLEGVSPLGQRSREKLYRLSDAVQGFVAMPLQGAEETEELRASRQRKSAAEASLLELKLGRESGELLPRREVADHAFRLVKAMQQRLGVRLPREISAQLYRAESEAQVAQVLGKEVERAFRELRQDHEAFLTAAEEDGGGEAR
jgi:transcriptional regulator with XRE-family HTH domain